MKNSKKMVEKAQRNKYERDRRRREFGYKVSYLKFITIGKWRFQHAHATNWEEKNSAEEPGCWKSEKKNH